MPTLAVNSGQTFASVILMACGPKTDFETKEQARTAQGLLKWEAQCAVTYLADPGQRAQSEVINVTITAAADPAAQLAAPCPVELVDLRAGSSAPEKRDNGRIVGGKLWYQAAGVRTPAQARAHREAA